jgi:probable phosphoglycerate mutase
MLKAGVTLYFVRHGETDWNLAQRYQGQQDIPLNATGRAQAAHNGRTLAAALGARAKDMHFIASPLLRARETMRIVRTELGLAPDAFATDHRLREISYGHWEGQLWADLAASDPDGVAARRADTWGWQPQGGESYTMLSERVGAWLADVAHDSIVVAHGGVSRVLRVLAGGLPPSELLAVGVPQDKVLVIARGRMDWL